MIKIPFVKNLTQVANTIYTSYLHDTQTVKFKPVLERSCFDQDFRKTCFLNFYILMTCTCGRARLNQKPLECTGSEINVNKN